MQSWINFRLRDFIVCREAAQTALVRLAPPARAECRVGLIRRDRCPRRSVLYRFYIVIMASNYFVIGNAECDLFLMFDGPPRTSVPTILYIRSRKVIFKFIDPNQDVCRCPFQSNNLKFFLKVGGGHRGRKKKFFQKIVLPPPKNLKNFSKTYCKTQKSVI